MPAALPYKAPVEMMLVTTALHGPLDLTLVVPERVRGVHKIHVEMALAMAAPHGPLDLALVVAPEMDVDAAGDVDVAGTSVVDDGLKLTQAFFLVLRATLETATHVTPVTPEMWEKQDPNRSSGGQSLLERLAAEAPQL
eukprot:TRINITY_DN50966_c0_g1_i1.p3 TRINITY_DN50966_c0_g1~~TRINITY_DN50966_c0_g1_i1.p3  ORF type:complete len:139 (-),score=23.13 TRINITY_DN50966_c0_g1_i1:23-439(-)